MFDAAICPHPIPAALDHPAHGAEGGWLSAASLLGALAAAGVTGTAGERHGHSGQWCNPARTVSPVLS